MNKKLLPLIVTILAIPASQAATTLPFGFSNIRFQPNGNVNMGATFTFVSNTTPGDPEPLPNDSNSTAPEITANFILTADFDGDATNDTLTFGLTATAVAPTDSTLFLNTNGIAGIGNVFLDVGESINYTVSVGEVVTSSGDEFAASFDGFTGGAFGNFNVGESYNANGEVFTTSTFDFVDSEGTLVPSETLLLTGVSGSVFTTGFDFGITVEAVPEPSSTAFLGLGALAFLARRRR